LDIAERKNLKLDITIDGNIDEETILLTKKAGTNVSIGRISILFREDCDF